MSVPIALMPSRPCEPVHMRCAPMRRTPAPTVCWVWTGGRDLGAPETGSRSRAGLHHGAAGPHMHGIRAARAVQTSSDGHENGPHSHGGHQPGPAYFSIHAG